MFCPDCNQPLKFSRWSKRLPAKSEALAICPAGCGKFQVRYFQGQPTSEPYQVRRTQKPCRGSYRITAKRRAAIVAVWGSVQNFLDYAPVVLISMSKQYKT